MSTQTTELRRFVEMNRIDVVRRKVQSVQKSVENIQLVLEQDQEGSEIKQLVDSLHSKLDAMIDRRLKQVRGMSEAEAA